MTGILIPTPAETDWLAARTKGVTASEIAIVMGLAPDDWGSPFGLYHQKLGNLPAADDTLSLRVGRHFESLVCELFAERHPEFALTGNGRTLYAHPDRPWQMATPDRLLSETWFEPADTDELVREVTGDPVATFDAKTSATYEGWGDDGSDEIPVYYRCQKLWQMDVEGVTAGYLACLFMHSRQLRVYELHMDADAEADLKLMREEAEMFLSRIARISFRSCSASASRWSS